MTDTTPGLRRAIEIVQAEIERAEALMLLTGGKAYDPGQMDAGLSALRTVLEQLQQEIKE